MHSVGVLFKQLLSNRDFCLRDPSDLVPFPLNSEENRSDYESSVIILTWWQCYPLEETQECVQSVQLGLVQPVQESQACPDDPDK